jgi:hypothetical protein
MSDAALIASITPAQPSECDCPECQKLCTVTPCLATPEDIARLLMQGLRAPLLVRTLWLAGVPIGIPGIEMVQINARPCGGCPLLADGRCIIHPIKPTGGRLANHVPSRLDQNPDTAVALTWLAPHNRALVEMLLTLFPA